MLPADWTSRRSCSKAFEQPSCLMSTDMSLQFGTLSGAVYSRTMRWCGNVTCRPEGVKNCKLKIHFATWWPTSKSATIVVKSAFAIIYSHNHTTIAACCCHSLLLSAHTSSFFHFVTWEQRWQSALITGAAHQSAGNNGLSTVTTADRDLKLFIAANIWDANEWHSLNFLK